MASCTDEPVGPDVDPPASDDPAVLVTSHSVSGVGTSAPLASGPLFSRVVVRNTGDQAAPKVVLVHSVPERFTVVGGLAAQAMEPIETSPVTIAGGDSLVLNVELTVPRFFPNGWSADIAITLRWDADGAGPNDPVETMIPTSMTLIQNDGLHFSLLAPGVPEVYWAGEFSGWSQTDPNYRLFKDASGRNWGITIPTTGRQSYKFNLFDPSTGRLEWIGDPHATRLTPDGFGGYNSVAGVDLPPPVAGIPGGIDPTSLVIYELFTCDFSTAGNFQAVIDGLTMGPQNLKDLGVNAIELLPVTGISPGFNWGYQPRFFFAVEPDYGTPEIFSSLVETAHAQGIAVILDMVFNHAGGGWPLEKVNDMGVPGTYINDGQAAVFGMRQLNWFSEDMRAFLLESALFWIEQYGIDGFRMDLVDSRDYAGYRWWRDEIKKRHPDFFLIGEDFTHPPVNSISAAGMDAQWGGQHTDQWGGVINHFQNIAMALLKEGPYAGRSWFPPRGSFDATDNPMWALANDMSPTDGNPSFTNDIRYIVSHDEHRLAWEVFNNGSPEAMNIGAARKAKLGAATLLLATGVPMLYMGEEIAATNFVGADPAPNKIIWPAADTSVRTYYRDLIQLRLNHPTLSEAGISFNCTDWNVSGGPCQQAKTFTFWRHRGANPMQADIVVALNFDHVDHQISLPFPSVGTWRLHDPEAGETPVSVTNGSLTITVPASSAVIYLK